MVMWERLGRVFVPDGTTPWMRSHAANPFAVPTGKDQFRIFFSARDEQNRSSVAWIDYDLAARRVQHVSDHPALGPGERGTFDDSGISVGCIVRDGDLLLLYYAGWNLAVTMPFRNSIGLAISRDGRTFERASRAPVLDRSEYDPFSMSYPFVLRRASSEWIMWYGSNVDWQPAHHAIKLAVSSDGRQWSPTGEICVGAEGMAFSRPSVLVDDDGYRMWYSFRGEKYRIGCATSVDGRHWTRRDDDLGLGPSASGWDSQEVSYPHVFRHGGETYMLYAGDGYGREGFGLARLAVNRSTARAEPESRTARRGRRTARK